MPAATAGWLGMPQFLDSKLKVTGLFKTGQSRLLGTWKAPADTDSAEDVLQGLFVTAHQAPLKPLPKVDNNTVKMDLSLPKQRIRHTFDLPSTDWLWQVEAEQGQSNAAKALANVGIKLPEGASAEINEQKQLVVHADIETLEVIQHWAAEEWRGGLKSLAVAMHIVRGPAHLLRRWLDQAAGQNDHSTLFEEVTAAAGRGEVKFAATTYVQGKSGEKLTTESVQQRSRITEISPSKGSRPNLATERKSIGAMLKIDPGIDERGEFIDLTYDLEWQPAEPLLRRQPLSPVPNLSYEFPHEDYHQVRVHARNWFADGSTRLVAGWRPSGQPEFETEDTLEVAFITAHVLRSRHLDFLTGQSAPEEVPGPGNKMELRVYTVLPDFLSEGDNTSKVPDSEASLSQQARSLLERSGVTFPEGGSVIYNASSHKLIVINTADNLELVDMLFSRCYRPLRTIESTLHLIEADGALIRQLIRESGVRADHRQELERLLTALAAGEATALNTLKSVSGSGQRITLAQAQEHWAIEGYGIDSKEVSFIDREMAAVGSQLEFDPIVEADGSSIGMKITMQHSPASPLLHTESLHPPGAPNAVEIPLTDYFIEKIETDLTMTTGTARIIAVWKPMGPEFADKNLLHIAILEASLVPVEE